MPRISNLFFAGFTTEICFVFQTMMHATCCIYLIPHVLITLKTCGEDHRLCSPSSYNCVHSLITSFQIQTFFAASCSQTPALFVVPTGETMFHAHIKWHAEFERFVRVLTFTLLDTGNDRIFKSRCGEDCRRGKSWSLTIRPHGSQLSFCGPAQRLLQRCGWETRNVSQRVCSLPIVKCPVVRGTLDAGRRYILTY